MSANHLEMHLNGLSANGLAAELAAISDINFEFLRLLTHPATHTLQQLAGLDASILKALRMLSSEQMRNLSVSPLPLAEFISIPDEVESASIGDQWTAFGDIDPSWQRQLNGFADRLLTFLWQAARRDKLTAAFCIGPNAERCLELARLSFGRISRCSDSAAGSLQARLSSHPSFWADRIRAARTGNDAQRIASRLSIIPLSVARKASTDTEARRRRSSARYRVPAD